jgi:hypothetical protein
MIATLFCLLLRYEYIGLMNYVRMICRPIVVCVLQNFKVGFRHHWTSDLATLKALETVRH